MAKKTKKSQKPKNKKRQTNKKKEREAFMKENELTRKKLRQMTSTDKFGRNYDALNKEKRTQLQKAYLDVATIMKEAKHRHGSRKESGKNNSDHSIDQYTKDVQRMVARILYDTGKKNILHITNEDVEEHIKTYENNYTAAKYMAALEYFQEASAKSNVFEVDLQFVRFELNENNDYLSNLRIMKEKDTQRDWTRRAKESTVAIINREERDQVLEKIEESNYHFKEQAHTAFKLACLTGKRASGIIDTKFSDIMINEKGDVFIKRDQEDFTSDEEEIVTYHQEKAGHHRLVEYQPVRDAEAISFLKELVSSKNNTSPDRRIFEFRNTKGKIVSDQEAQQELSSIVSNCADRVEGLNESKQTTIKVPVLGPDGKSLKNANGKVIYQNKVIEKKVTLHSGRKHFAQSRTDWYASLSYSDLMKETKRRIASNQKAIAQEKQRVERLKAKGKKDAEINQRHFPNFADKYETLKQRINWIHPPNPKAGYEGERRTKKETEPRNPNHKELTFFLASLDIGHQRNDVMAFYSVYTYNVK